MIDGDTIVAKLDLGWRISLEQSVRLEGLLAPELKVHEGVLAREYLASLVRPGDKVTVVSKKILGSTEKYGRVLAHVLDADGNDISVEMINAGHALPARS